MAVNKARIAALAALAILVRPSPNEPPRWPEAGARLVAPASRGASATVRRVFLDAGHGAKNNSGNVSSRCAAEQDFTLFAAREIGARLKATKRFEIEVSRGDNETVEYAARVDEAARWNADAFVSIHSDIRGVAKTWTPIPGKECPYLSGHLGFSVIYSDEGDTDLTSRRLLLARSTARELEAIGLPPFDGAIYGDSYEKDSSQRGVFVDRHALDHRIFVLKRTTMPAILLETHNALDPAEVDRWAEPETFDAVAVALARALDEAIGQAPPIALE